MGVLDVVCTISGLFHAASGNPFSSTLSNCSRDSILFRRDDIPTNSQPMITGFLYELEPSRDIVVPMNTLLSELHWNSIGDWSTYLMGTASKFSYHYSSSLFAGLTNMEDHFVQTQHLSGDICGWISQEGIDELASHLGELFAFYSQHTTMRWYSASL
eukprot:gene31412-40804_t